MADSDIGPVPQPGLDRMVDFRSGPVLAAVVPDQNPLVVVTAARLVAAVGQSVVQLAYVDTSRYTVEELPDGSVHHAPLSPDADVEDWHRVRAELETQIGEVLAGSGTSWKLWYLAGRPDRSLTHLARVLDASVIVIGTRHSRGGHRFGELLEGSVAGHLAHHQHRPVLTVPVETIDWKDWRTPWRR
ncbi:universal stress protein [Acidipropionibacterium jensenii]|uniref:Universal stress protein family n=1 Tax=Acidipropionibacterium jensenii TaxID=1749 RepID=A0A448NYA0_9ACTN|nr:universal stress protein [Acidipropionibacterium jensenii]MDN5977181.1 universal stress protein [Acidipropionibacterium jensenii]MDN5996708.1 universal stress protein [Acidipropionibacterium jensenii]MDN6020933.1 universal stress protein [Acidipropionibacterium jensenii]MDN6427077.1 universal stress protein [Acidipropionibacterium jensenii]MDN6441050.1 universal stress protein [Acidipropionibacterium jensenii]